MLNLSGGRNHPPPCRPESRAGAAVLAAYPAERGERPGGLVLTADDDWRRLVVGASLAAAPVNAALLPIKHQARAYENAVDASRKGNNEERSAQYRLYEVQNGNHIESYVAPFPELVLIQPHAQRAFDLLVDHVETNTALPPSQCIPKAGTISPSPSQPGHCASLFVP